MLRTLRQYNTKVELGRARLANVSKGLPAVLWWVVAFGALMNIILIWMHDIEIDVQSKPLADCSGSNTSGCISLDMEMVVSPAHDDSAIEPSFTP